MSALPEQFLQAAIKRDPPEAFARRLERNFEALRGTSGSAWANATLVNDWVAHSVDYDTPGYRKGADGRVYLRGLLKNGSAANATMFTLPAGFWPAKQKRFRVDTNGTAATLQVTAAGVVNCPVNGNTTYTSLDGVSFDAA